MTRSEQSKVFGDQPKYKEEQCSIYCLNGHQTSESFKDMAELFEGGSGDVEKFTSIELRRTHVKKRIKRVLTVPS